MDDAHGGSDTGTIRVTVDPVGDVTELTVGTFTSITEDQALTGANLMILDSTYVYDVDRITNPAFEDLEISNLIVTTPSIYYDLQISADSKYIIVTASTDWNGDIDFQYQVTDAYGLTSALTASTITLAQVNDAPIANDDETTIDEGDSVTYNVTANDTDVDNDVNLNALPNVDDKHVLSASLTVGTMGSVSIVGDDEITFTPAANASGVAVINYVLEDAFGATDTATLTININEEMDPPVAVYDETTVAEGSSDNEIVVIDNDYDVDTDPSINTNPAGPIYLDIVLVTAPSHGSASVVDDKIVYTPDADFDQTDTLVYTLIDADGMTDTATVTIHVSPASDIPEADSPNLDSFDEDTVLTIDMSEHTRDVDTGDTLTINIETNGSNGTGVYSSVTNTITYTPDADFNGTDTIDYSVTDRQGNVVNGTLYITVDQVNDNPVCLDDIGSGDEDTVITVNVLGNDSDVDMVENLNADHTLEAMTIDPNGFVGVTNGTVIVSPTDPEEIIFTPDLDFNGVVTFIYTVLDNFGGSIRRM